jgi:hypothetical protein
VDIRSLFVADAQAAKLIKPSESSFYDPSPTAQSAAMFGVSLGEQWPNPANSQALPDCLRIIPTVTDDTTGTTAGAPSLSLQNRDSINKGQCLLRIVTIGPGELNRQGNSAPVANQMALAAKLSPIRGVRAGLLPPKTARTEQLSTTAFDQSIWE